MELYFASAEQPKYLQQLIDFGVSYVAVSYYEWERRHANANSVDALHKHIPEGINIVVTPGIARKEDLDFSAFARGYVEFCEKNAEHAIIYGLDSKDCPESILRDTRKHLDFFPNIVVFPIADETHLDLAGEYERVGVNANAAKSLPTTELRRIPASLFGSNITDPKVLGPGRFEATTSFAWLSGRRFGELWLFVKGHLRHFTADQLQRAVRSYSDDLAALGVDPAAVSANDKNALTEVAVKSLLAMAESLSGRPRDRHKVEKAAVSPDSPSTEVEVSRGTLGAAPASTGPEERERITLPVLVDDAGHGANPESLRQCDSCDLSDVCPQYKPSSMCSFNIPVEIKTDEDWEKACQTILEWQFGRVAHGVFAEQVNGGSLTARVGQEMDRFNKLLGQLKELKRIEAPGQGALSKILAEVIPQAMGGGSNGAQEEVSVEDAEVLDEDDEDEE